MNIVDIVIVIFLLCGALIGFARGFIKETVIFVGTIVVVIGAFILKDVIAVFLYQNLPFINFGGFFKGITSLNIIFYEIVGFFLALIGLSIISNSKSKNNDSKSAFHLVFPLPYKR